LGRRRDRFAEERSKKSYPTRFGIQISQQNTTWPEILALWREAVLKWGHRASSSSRLDFAALFALKGAIMSALTTVWRMALPSLLQALY
jgi:hypothetical protein